MNNHIDEIKKILDKFDYVGVSLLHTDGSRIDYNESFGYKDLDALSEITPNTIFRVASISKVIVCLACLKLYEQGLVDLTNDISEYLGYKIRNPYYPKTAITLEMLMTQTSSISDAGFNNKGYDGVNTHLYEVSLKRMLIDPSYEHYNKDTYLNSKPGSTWCYSNFGCGIMACIVELVSGMLFTDYVKQVILDPLNIDGGFRITDIASKNYISSLYKYDKGFHLTCNLESFMKNQYPRFSLGDNFRGPAGGLFISILDLSKIIQLLMNKGVYNSIHLFEESTIKEMEKVHWKGISNDPEYKAKGLQLLLLDGYSKYTLKGHFGCAYGLRSFMLYNDSHGYIMICNGANYLEGYNLSCEFNDLLLKKLVDVFEEKE